MSGNFYTVLWVDKNADDNEIKKAYRKKAMQYHPDKNKGDKTAEEKFKEVNEAYQTLSDSNKRKQYDMFGSAWWAGWNPFWWWASWFGGFEDIFWWAWRWRTQSSWFNMEDLFWNMWWWNWWFWWQHQRRQEPKKEPVSLDFEKTYEIPIFDLILGCTIEVRWVYWQTKKIKIPKSTKPWAKMRVKEFWKSEWTKKGNLIINIQAKMPKSISEVDLVMLERIRDGVGY